MAIAGTLSLLASDSFAGAFGRDRERGFDDAVARPLVEARLRVLAADERFLVVAADRLDALLLCWAIWPPFE